MAGKIYGVGVGPGDPELLTIKAARLIKNAGVIGIPAEHKETCKAYQIAAGAVEEIRGKRSRPVSISHDQGSGTIKGEP